MDKEKLIKKFSDYEGEKEYKASRRCENCYGALNLYFKGEN